MPLSIASVAATASITSTPGARDRFCEYRELGEMIAYIEEEQGGADTASTSTAPSGGVAGTVAASATGPSANTAFSALGVGRTLGEKVLEQTMRAVGGKAGTDALGAALGRSPVAGVLTLGGASTASYDSASDCLTNGLAVSTMIAGYVETAAKNPAGLARVLATTAGKGAMRAVPVVGNALLVNDIVSLVGPEVERVLRAKATEGCAPAQSCVTVIDAGRAEISDLGRRAQGLGHYEATDIAYGA